MKPVDQPVLRDIVLVGGGHSHVGVLRRFAMQPEAGVRLTLVCTDVDTPYSGMLPGYVAGHYEHDDVHIDLRRLCTWAGARFIRAEVIGLDRQQRRVLLRGRPDVAYDVVSLNTGSTPRMDAVPGAAGHAVAVKPIHRFNGRWLALLERARQHTGPLSVAVVGGGAGGVELTLAMQWRLRQVFEQRGLDPDGVRLRLFSAAPGLLPTHNHWVRAHFERVLNQRGVDLHLGAPVVQVDAGRLLAAGQWHSADEVVWVTQAGGPHWLAETGLPLDGAGFVQVNPFLQSPADPRIFAAGDVASWLGRPLEKAGVFAVRMGVPLADNLRRLLRGQALRPYRPQRHWLSLISTGDRVAVASRGPFAWSGGWVWRWKDAIDRRFMRRFTELASRMPATLAAAPALAGLSDDETRQAEAALSMRCSGCAAKVGSGVLAQALGGLWITPRPDVLVGLGAPDDAAIVRVPPGRALVHSVDFFRAFVDDPYRVGRIAAHHALGDLFAMGAEPQSAAAIVTIPPGVQAQVARTLHDLMTGAVEVLNAAGCALVGGHTGEGAELAIGFSVHGLVDEALRGVTRKGGLQPGDALVLTKALGTGVLLAAHDQGLTRGRWIEAALDAMDHSNQLAAQTLARCGAGACTDVTGFGLLGHALEMARAAQLDIEITLDALPLLDGAAHCAAIGVASSLLPANRRVERDLHEPDAHRAHPAFPLLLDPQTAGGLLASVPAEQAAACVDALRAAGYGRAAVVGRVRPAAVEGGGRCHLH